MERTPQPAEPALSGQVIRRVHAPAAVVYAAITDLPQMGRFSPECVGGRWLDGATRAAVGVRFRGHNRFRWMRWSRIVQITVADPPHTFEFRTLPGTVLQDRTVWNYRFEPVTDTETVVTESFEIRQSPSWFIRLLDRIAGRDWADPTPGMRTTLERLDRELTTTGHRRPPPAAASDRQ